MRVDKKFIFAELLPILITFAAVLGVGIAYKQMAIKLLPVCISLVVMLLNSRANRWGFILGGVNCLVYAVGYTLEKLYGTLLSTLFGFVIQIVSFFCWKKRAYGNATMFRKMKVKYEILLGAGLLAAWFATAVVLKKIGGAEYVLDSLTMLLGFVLPILTMFAFLEALPLNIINMCVTLTLWIRIVAAGNLANLTYLIYSVYCTYMTIRTVITWIKLYREQRAKTATPTTETTASETDSE